MPTDKDGDERRRASKRRSARRPPGEVVWWDRPPPQDSDPDLWESMQRIHVRRQQVGMSVTELARRLSRGGFTIRRETLSRILNGKQPTTWDTAHRLADILGLDLTELVERGDPANSLSDALDGFVMRWFMRDGLEDRVRKRLTLVLDSAVRDAALRGAEDWETIDTTAALLRRSWNNQHRTRR